MNIAGAVGGAVAGIIVATTSYGWLCAAALIPVCAMGLVWVRVRATANIDGPAAS